MSRHPFRYRIGSTMLTVTSLGALLYPANISRARVLFDKSVLKVAGLMLTISNGRMAAVTFWSSGWVSFDQRHPKTRPKSQPKVA